MGEKEKIREYLKYKGVSKNKFYTQTGLSIGFLDSGNSLGVDKLRIIINSYPDLNLNWLIWGQGEMIKHDHQEAKFQIANKFPLRTDRVVDSQLIPLYNLEATAGLVELFTDAKTVPISYISLPDLPACDGAVYVRGDSMYPLLKSGDIVLYKQVHDLQYGIFWGEMYLISFSIDGEEFITIKYIQKSEQDGFIKLVSHNPHHNPKDIPISMIRALAIIKASVRYNTIR